MSKKTLDRSRSYGEVWGGVMNARFMQDGLYFNHEGEQVTQLVDRSEEGSNAAPAPLPAAPETVIDAETIINARRGLLMPKALMLLEGKADDIVAELADQDEDMLSVMLEVEGLVKKRVGVTAALNEALQAKKDEAARNAAAHAQPPVNVPTATFGTMDGQSQLAAQLGS